MGATHFHLPAPNAIHFCAPASASEGESMDLYDIFAGAESVHVRKLLEHPRGLTDAQLDEPLNNPAHVFPWDSPAQRLRDLLRRLVVTKDIWTAALTRASLHDVGAEPTEH